ncbi:MAG: peptidoglycan-binding protein LysM [Bacteroidota bacterium]
MGLFSFLKNAGSKLFSKNEKERDSTTTDGVSEEVANEQKVSLLKSVVDTLGIDVQNFDVEIDNDTAKLFGQVETQEQKEKVILAVGNVAGIAIVNDDYMTVEKPEDEATFYTVEKGDYLSKIAKEVYGDPMKYNLIFEANKPMLSDPDKIYPGQVLRIPKA